MNEQITLEDVKTFLKSQLNLAAEPVLIGAGAWSQCFAFHDGKEDLVIRFGQHLSDFNKDQLAYRYQQPSLPIPRVLEIGEALGGYYAISTRVYGVPLESVRAPQWRQVVPSLVSALEAMRLADISAFSGFGSWEEGKANYPCWSEYLLAVAEDTAQKRTHGWRKRLEATAQADDFSRGYDLLKTLLDEVPRSLVHSDLINRNVLVNKGKISGIFDWGCALYGDHLYDLAWLEFWSPWYPELDMELLHSQLEQRWLEADYSSKNKVSRLLACYLHIGLDHLAYNAYQGNALNLAATAKRLRAFLEAG